MKMLKIQTIYKEKLVRMSAISLALMSFGISDLSAQVEYFGSTVGEFTADANGEDFTADIVNSSNVTIATLSVNVSGLTGDFNSSTTSVFANEPSRIGSSAGVIEIGEPDEPDPEVASSANISFSISNVASGYRLSGLSVTSNSGVLALDSLTNITSSPGAEFIEASGGIDLVNTSFAAGTPFALPSMIDFNLSAGTSANGFRAAEHSNQWAINAEGVENRANIGFTYNTAEVPSLFLETLVVTTEVVAVPEPSSCLLLGVFGIVSLCYKKRQ